MNLSDKLLYYAIDWTMRLVPRQPRSRAALPPLCRQRARFCARHARMRIRMRAWLSPGGWADGWMGMDAAGDRRCRHGEQHETDQARVAVGYSQLSAQRPLRLRSVAALRAKHRFVPHGARNVAVLGCRAPSGVVGAGSPSPLPSTGR
jgi:hypothetical protein